MEKLYENAGDLHVASYIVYGHTDGKVYADADHKKTITKEELEHVFKVGRLIVKDGSDLMAAVGYGSTGVKTLTKATNLDFKVWAASAKEEE